MRPVLAQVNIGRLRAPLDSPMLADFVAGLDPVNALADVAPGFVWRLQTEEGNATGVRAFDWDAAGSAGVIVNMSVWESVEALAAFVYSDAHRQVLRRRREWFAKMAEAYAALWWIPGGSIPATDQAEDRVRYLRAYGPTPYAFTLRAHFPPPGDAAPQPHAGRHHAGGVSAAGPALSAAAGTARRSQPLVEALRPFIGLWVAVRDDEVLVAAPSPKEVVAWLAQHRQGAQSMFRVPGSEQAVTGVAPH